MKVLFAAAEVAPFSKVGGLADVMGSMPKFLEKKVDMAIFTPLHGSIDREKFGIKKMDGMEVWIDFQCQPQRFNLYTCKMPGTKIDMYFVENEWYFSCFKDV